MFSESTFFISENFEVDPMQNRLRKKQGENTLEEIPLEPRMMKVLVVLAEKSPTVVLRSELIEKVWNNYGGADDALNQTISHLRKVLDDSDKENRLIETIAKKGYVLHQVSFGEDPAQVKKQKMNLTWLWVALVAAGISVAVCFMLWHQSKKNDTVAPLAPAHNPGSTHEAPAAP